jgi:membrane protein DedA with SNARE-associated domain
MTSWPQAIGDFFWWLAGGMMRFAADHTYWALLLVLVVEEAGVPLPVPGDTIILYAGYRVSLGRLNPLLAVLCVAVATLAGSSLLYWVARLGGHTLVFRYGRYVRLDRARLVRMERWVQRHQAAAIVLGRLVPGLRTAVTIAAGIFEVRFPAFLLYTGLSSILWAVAYLTAGALLGREYDQLAAYILAFLRLPGGQLALGLALVGLGLWWLARRRAAGRRRHGGDRRADAADAADVANGEVAENNSDRPAPES